MLEFLRIILRELFYPFRSKRLPEPQALMSDPLQVIAFDREGQAGGSMLPIYKLNVVSVSRLIPPNGFLLDLGSGSGEFLAHLALYRTDIRILGMDASDTMVSEARNRMKKLGIDNRVEIKLADITELEGLIPNQIDCISCVFTLHHLWSKEEVSKCISSIAKARKEYGCAVWIYDFVRPKNPKTASRFAEFTSPNAEQVFKNDVTNSLRAAYTFRELSQIIFSAGLTDVHKALSQPFYQAYWAQSDKSLTLPIEKMMTEDQKNIYQYLVRFFKNLP